MPELTFDSQFWSRFDKTSSECWLWTGPIDRKNPLEAYGSVSAPWGTDKVHRVAWRLTHGEIPDGFFVCHRCDVRLCGRPVHLFLGTPQDNLTDCVAKGRMHYGDAHGLRKHPERAARGSRSGTAKLSEEDVRRIRAAYVRGKTGYIRLASQFGVSPRAIELIIKRETWSHVV